MAGSNGLAPAKKGMIFSPSLAQVNLPVTNSPQDFKAYQQCPDFVINGSFETDEAWTTERVAATLGPWFAEHRPITDGFTVTP